MLVPVELILVVGAGPSPIELSTVVVLVVTIGAALARGVKPSLVEVTELLDALEARREDVWTEGERDELEGVRRSGGTNGVAVAERELLGAEEGGGAAEVNAATSMAAGEAAGDLMYAMPGDTRRDLGGVRPGDELLK